MIEPHRDDRRRESLQSLANAGENGVELGFLGFERRVDQNQRTSLDGWHQCFHGGVTVTQFGARVGERAQCLAKRLVFGRLQLTGEQSILRAQPFGGEQG